MRTLSSWVNRLARGAASLECAVMQMRSAFDGEEPIWTGSGRIEIVDDETIRYTMHAEARDHLLAIRRLRACEENPYDHRNAFRLLATDYDGVEWNAGWTAPKQAWSAKTGWLLQGRVQGLTTGATGSWVSRDRGVELVFTRELRLPFTEGLVKEARYDSRPLSTIRQGGRHVLSVLATEIAFEQDPWEERVWLVGKTSSELDHCFMETWVSEPLHLLLGEFAFPRMIARNFGDGTAFVTLRRCPRLRLDIALASVLEGDPMRHQDEFWKFYGDYLTLVADTQRGDIAHALDGHPITRMYWEVIQAARGSRWVLCMTLASCAEGIAKLLMEQRGTERAVITAAAASARRHVRDWRGDRAVRGRILGFIKQIGKPSTARFLKSLIRSSELEERHVDAWSRVRHHVMHGNLVEPWGSDEGDKEIIVLSELVHRLTKLVVAGHRPLRAPLPP